MFQNSEDPEIDSCEQDAIETEGEIKITYLMNDDENDSP